MKVFHHVKSERMKENKGGKQTLESAQNGLEIIFKGLSKGLQLEPFYIPHLKKVLLICI